ncbi:MAG: SDR family oxidoreductase [Flavobacteriales bacterium]|nr:SDR family oxidoreductase [Flavobacteriales bacterium]MCB9447753.1 SDR family oxidoreductase [Flavobacteriales bacterium]
MDLGLKNKVAFVAASSQGLGKAVALELALEGAHVIISGRHTDVLEQARKEIEKTGGHPVLALAGDLSVQEDRDHMIRQTLEQYGHVDILVTNSGGPRAGCFDELRQQDWDQAYQLLLASVVGLIRGFSGGMKERGWGRIITITSQAVKQPVDTLMLSNAIRTAVVGLMKSLSNEWGAYGVTVNNVMPGYTETDRLKKLIANNPEFANATSEIPLGRFARPDEFAAAVLFLVSEKASYITGVSLAVDGGWIKGL